MTLFPELTIESIDKRTPTTFRDNMKLPIHRWFRYSAGFSAEWVRSLLDEAQAEGRTSVFDPFAGSGTVLVEGSLCGFQSLGSDPHPLVSRIAQAKLSWQVASGEFWAAFQAFVAQAEARDNVDTSHFPDLIHRVYSVENLVELEQIRLALSDRAFETPVDKLIWLSVVAILRATSSAGTAQWQYLLPNKSKARVLRPFDALKAMGLVIHSDLEAVQADLKRRDIHPGEAYLMATDIRNTYLFPENVADLVITSPPYANNYDYADATRLEMTFLREIKGWSDLQDTVRSSLVRACTQHVSRIEHTTYEAVASPLLTPIAHQLETVVRALDVERFNHGGKKQYHTMLAYYFLDMAQALITTRQVCVSGARACWVIGDSAPYGIYAPVDRWLGELALSVGFKSFRFEKVRDRNTKWKNRKHTVPLKEGYLWLEG